MLVATLLLLLTATLHSSSARRTPASLTHGPVLGAVTPTSIRILFRADREATVSVDCWRLGPPSAFLRTLPMSHELTEPDATQTTRLDPSNDLVGVVVLTDLTPNSVYAYQVLLNGQVQRHLAASFGSSRAVVQTPGRRSASLPLFTTLPLPATSARVAFAFGSCLMHEQSPFRVLDLVQPRAHDVDGDGGRLLEVDFMALLGDQIYADFPSSNRAERLRDFHAKYRENWAEPHLARLLREVPTFKQIDDHEVADNWLDPFPDPPVSAREAQKAEALRKHALRAYATYQHSTNPQWVDENGEDVLYYALDAGPARMFLLDTRSHRDRAAKTMLGEVQLARLLHWLEHSSPGVVKVLASPVMWSRFHHAGCFDSWCAADFVDERDRIFEFIASKAIRNVLLLSADAHFVQVNKISLTNGMHLHEFSVSPLGFRPTQVPEHVRARTQARVRKALAERATRVVQDEQSVFTYDKTRVVGHVAVEGGSVLVRVVSEKGEVFRLRLVVEVDEGVGEGFGEGVGEEEVEGVREEEVEVVEEVNEVNEEEEMNQVNQDEHTEQPPEAEQPEVRLEDELLDEDDNDDDDLSLASITEAAGEWTQLGGSFLFALVCCVCVVPPLYHAFSSSGYGKRKRTPPRPAVSRGGSRPDVALRGRARRSQVLSPV